MLSEGGCIETIDPESIASAPIDRQAINQRRPTPGRSVPFDSRGEFRELPQLHFAANYAAESFADVLLPPIP